MDAAPSRSSLGNSNLLWWVIITDYLVSPSVTLQGGYDDPLYRSNSEASVLWTSEPPSAWDRLTMKHF